MEIWNIRIREKSTKIKVLAARPARRGKFRSYGREIESAAIRIIAIFTLFSIFINAPESTNALARQKSNGQNNHASKKEVQANLAQVLEKHCLGARAKLKHVFNKANLAYPPKKLVFLGLKDEELLIVLVPDSNEKFVSILTYPIMAASGEAGPKLKEGDLQVPEGIYKICSLNPNSIAHLALRVDYPNEFDKMNARLDKRTNLGCDIEIHGSYWSKGCLAMGNEAIEEIFVLAHDIGCENIKLILAPCDLRKKKVPLDMEKQPSWLDSLYNTIATELENLVFETSPYKHETIDSLHMLEKRASEKFIDSTDKSDN